MGEILAILHEEKLKSVTTFKSVRAASKFVVGGCFFPGPFGVPAGHYSGNTYPSIVLQRERPIQVNRIIANGR